MRHLHDIRAGDRRRRAGAGQRHPRRRELLGALSRTAACRSCARSISRCTHDAERPAGQARRLSASSIRRATRCRTCSRAAGSATTSPSGSATRRTTPPGTRLHRTREHLQGNGQAQDSARARQRSRKAWEEMYIAEGSDWFWWFGDDHSSARTPCSTTCSASTCRTSTCCWATTPPADLSRPISQRGQRLPHTLPRALSRREDRRPARRSSSGSAPAAITCQNERGTMAMVDARAAAKTSTSASTSSDLLVRVDCDGPARDGPGRLRHAAHRLRRAGRLRVARRTTRAGPTQSCAVVLRRRPAGQRPHGRGRRRSDRWRWPSRSTLLGVAVGRAGAVLRRAAAKAGRAATARRARGPSRSRGRRRDFELIMWDV